MTPKVELAFNAVDKPGQCAREVLVEQLLWLIQLRWIAAVGLVIAALVGSYVFHVLISPVPIYVCGGVLLLCNILYYLVATKKGAGVGL